MLWYFRVDEDLRPATPGWSFSKASWAQTPEAPPALSGGSCHSCVLMGQGVGWWSGRLSWWSGGWVGKLQSTRASGCCPGGRAGQGLAQDFALPSPPLSLPPRLPHPLAVCLETARREGHFHWNPQQETEATFGLLSTLLVLDPAGSTLLICEARAASSVVTGGPCPIPRGQVTSPSP